MYYTMSVLDYRPAGNVCVADPRQSSAKLMGNLPSTPKQAVVALVMFFKTK